MAPDLPTDLVRELDARLEELRPLLSEYERQLAASDALGTGDGASHDGGAPGAERTLGATQRRRARRAGRDRDARASKRAASSSRTRAAGPRKLTRAQRGATRRAILAALEHELHTTSELVSVTALGGRNTRTNLRRLLAEGKVTKTKRASRTAYAPASGAVEASTAHTATTYA
jgi:DNA-binding transcriptional ArsR family regulator